MRISKKFKKVIGIASVTTAFIFSNIISYKISKNKYKPKNINGKLRIDTSESKEQPYIFLEINTKDMNDILNSNHVCLKVSNEKFK